MILLDYYIECRNIFEKTELSIFNDQDEEIGKIRFNKLSDKYQIEFTNLLSLKSYYVL